MVTTRGKQSASTAVPVTAVKEESRRGTTTKRGGVKPRTSKASAIEATVTDTEGPEENSRVRKRRRIDTGPGGDRPQSGKRCTRKKDLDTNVSSTTCDLPTHDENQAQSGLPDCSLIDPHPVLSVDVDGKDTERDLERPKDAGIASGGPHSSSREDGDPHNRVAEFENVMDEVRNDASRSFIRSAAPDLSTVIESIIKHGETIDEHYSAKGLNELGIVDTESFLPLGASAHLKIQSLAILDNLSVQILNVLAKSTYREIVTITENPDSEAGQAYATLKSLFDHTKKVYSVHDPFLIPQEIGLTEPSHIDTIRKANLATFVSSVFGGQDVGFYHLNEFFLDTFVGEGGRLLKNQAQIFLDLKTQAYISARSYAQRPKEELLEDIFPAHMEEQLLARKGSSNLGSRPLAPSEMEFLQRARNRCQALMGDPDFQEVEALSRRYAWEDFLRDISTYVSKNFESLLGQPMQKKGPLGRTPNYFVPPRTHGVDQVQSKERPSSEKQSTEEDSKSTASQNDPLTASNDMAAQESHTADSVAHGLGFQQSISIDGPDNAQSQPQDRVQSTGQSDGQSEKLRNEVSHGLPAPPQDMQYQYNRPTPHVFYNHSPFVTEPTLQPHFSTAPVNMNLQQQFYGDQPANPHPTQSAPTQVLYERARQAATAKASPSNRRAGHPSQRRPWSHEEENALMAGLDRVKGPHWSQILAMFGPGGTINESLKDRNQVQLKDKARNLKLFFLKSGIEVPYYLQFVTGELKTRAPGQALKNEAKEKENDSEERAHVEGVFALAYGPDSTQETRNGEAPIPHLGAPDLNQNSNGTREISTEDTEGSPAVQNDISVQLANAAQGLSHSARAPEANMTTYNGNNSLSLEFQAMVDLAVAEASRVNSGGA